MATDPEILNLKDGSTLAIDTGNFFLAPVGTEPSEALDTIEAPWKGVGHTSLEEVLAFASEGGEETTLGTLQNPNLRVRVANRSESIAITLQQFDEDTLKLYFGKNMANTGDPRFMGVPTRPQPTESALLVVCVDGDHTFSIWAPKVSISRGDDMSLPDTESLAGLPINIKPLQHLANSWTYAVTPIAELP